MNLRFNFQIPAAVLMLFKAFVAFAVLGRFLCVVKGLCVICLMFGNICGRGASCRLTRHGRYQVRAAVHCLPGVILRGAGSSFSFLSARVCICR